MVKVITRHFRHNYNQNGLFSMANSVIPNYPQTTQMINFLLDGKHTFIVSEKSQSNNNQKRIKKKHNLMFDKHLILQSHFFLFQTSLPLPHSLCHPFIALTSTRNLMSKKCVEIFSSIFIFFCRRRRGLPID